MAEASRLRRAFRRCRTLALVFTVALNLLALDQLTKYWAQHSLKGTPGIEVVPNFFNLYFVGNRGCAWGMFQGQVLPLAIFSVAALVFLVWKRRSVFGEGRLAFWMESLLYAGIVGNLIDRTALGYVVDFFDFHWYAHHFPVFNCADVFISVAAGLMVISAFIQSRKEKADGAKP